MISGATKALRTRETMGGPVEARAQVVDEPSEAGHCQRECYITFKNPDPLSGIFFTNFPREIPCLFEIGAPSVSSQIRSAYGAKVIDRFIAPVV